MAGISAAPRPSGAADSADATEQSDHGSRAGRRRRKKEDVLNTCYVVPETGEAFEFTFKFGANSWQAKCLHHDPDVNAKGSNTWCTKTVKVLDGDDATFVDREQQVTIALS